MKLNAASEMLPLSRAEFMNIHPYAPEEQVEGYTELIENLCCYLAEITGFKGVTLQPNSGAAGEYTGLRVIRAYLESIGQGHRNIVLLPASATELIRPVLSSAVIRLLLLNATKTVISTWKTSAPRQKPTKTTWLPA